MQNENLAAIISALSDTTTLKKLVIKLNGSLLREDKENVIFSNRSEELSSALENAIGANMSLEELQLVNLRFGNLLVDAVGKGLKHNKALRTVNLSGNLMVSRKGECRIGVD